MLAGGWTGERGTTDPSLAPGVSRDSSQNWREFAWLGWAGLDVLGAKWTSDLKCGGHCWTARGRSAKPPRRHIVLPMAHTCVQLLLNYPPLHARDNASLALVTFVALAARCGVVANSVREIRSLRWRQQSYVHTAPRLARCNGWTRRVRSCAANAQR